jgi:hypothetical protein
MAKQQGPNFITGTVGGICFYSMDGKFYARRKSSLSKKRVKNDPAFELTRVYAGLMGRASKIASAVYQTLPRDTRKHELYRALTGKALQSLKEGLDETAVKERLLAELAVTKPAPKPERPIVVMPGKSVVRTVWQQGGKIVVECKAPVAATTTTEKKRPRVCGSAWKQARRRAVDNSGQLTWTVIRSDREYEVRLPERRCLSS